MVTKEELLKLTGSFSWDFGCYFLIETCKGNFVWSDPEYHGENTIQPFAGTVEDFYKNHHVPYVRDKGIHFIKDYCGEDFTMID
jgi:hypothetical protein